MRRELRKTEQSNLLLLFIHVYTDPPTAHAAISKRYQQLQATTSCTVPHTALLHGKDYRQRMFEFHRANTCKKNFLKSAPYLQVSVTTPRLQSCPGNSVMLPPENKSHGVCYRHFLYHKMNSTAERQKPKQTLRGDCKSF